MDIRTLPALSAAALALEAARDADYSTAASDALRAIYDQMTLPEISAYLDIIRFIHAFRQWGRCVRAARFQEAA